MNETYTGLVTRVIDGDTVEVDINLGFGLVASRTIRLMGINCPEKFGPTKDLGLKAKARTKELAEGKACRVQMFGREKYGRDLGVLNIVGDDGTTITCVNDKLVIEGLAVNALYKMTSFSDADDLATELMRVIAETAGWDAAIQSLTGDQYADLLGKLKETVTTSLTPPS